MLESTTDVLICGAGAAGLALAIDLARRGVDFRLIDKAETPFRGSRGKGIQPRSLEVFEDYGIVDRLFATGGPYPPIREYGPDGNFVDSALSEVGGPTPAEPYRAPLMVPQFLTEAVMRERLAELGYQTELGRELTGFSQDSEAVTALVGGEVVRTRFLVGTDGGRSFVRQSLGIGFPGETLRARAIVADVELEGIGRDAWHRFGSGMQQILICPLAGTQLFQVQGPVPLEGDVDLSAEGLTALVAERTGRDIPIRSISWASAYSMNARLADRYRVGRVFLAGDAAHIHPPTGGQGLNTSVQDSYNLGWKLAAVLAGGASEKLLATYAEERRPIAASMLGLATRLLDESKQGIMRRGRETRQLDLGYLGTSLALQTRDCGGVRAGERAPDAPVRGAAGQPTRLFSLFRGPHWTLLGCEAERADMAARPGLHVHIVGPHGDVVDDGGHFRDAYRLSPGDWVLVRPDGYIGAIVETNELPALERYLAEAGVTALSMRRNQFAAGVLLADLTPSRCSTSGTRGH
jgi:2-polyprenyl-6-methoxyphenol hydroxylase-like FAD-dependent oxidoreductase